jgi:tRNA pseudouridine13 synthase
MKLKQQPEDFQVEELSDVVSTGLGAFAFYRLEKRGWSTPDAIQAIRRRWGVDLRRVSYGGLKDRHAQTVQYLTIHHGPRRGLTHQSVTVEYLGQVPAPYTSRDIRANRFQLTLRGLQPAEVASAQKILAEVRADGVPNYFDDQRFGSVAAGAEFIARALVLGRFEEALKLALTAPYEYDRAPQKQEKAILRAHWGDWPTCKAELPRSHARSLVDYLVYHPSDFHGAVARLRPELRGLYLSAYQSFLWNRMLARWIAGICRPEQVVPVALRLGTVPMHRSLDEEQRKAFEREQLPLPSARLKLEPGDPHAGLIEGVLAEEGIPLKDLKIKGIREMYFSKGERAALCLPAHLEHEAGADERHPGGQKLLLAFELPRGSYATLILKRIQAAAGSS